MPNLNPPSWAGREPFSAPIAEEPVDKLRAAERKELERLQKVEAALQDAATRRFEPWVVPVTEHVAESPGYPMTIWSDWHWGEVVNRDETGGDNEFNYDIAMVRAENLVNNTINLLRNYGGRTPQYEGITVCLGGDLLSGSIHDELVQTNWTTVAGQALEVHSVIAGMLIRLADEFGRVEVPCVVGNHGRNARKPPAKRRVWENSEHALHVALERHFANDPRVTFKITMSTDIFLEVNGHKFLLTHGDALGTKGGDGIIGAIGPIMRGSVKIGGAERRRGRDFDTMIIGHWHSAQPRGELFPVIVNGTFKGFDEYAHGHLRAAPSKPTQQLWLVTPKHGLAAQWSIDL